MRVELLEGDGLLHPDGIPQNVIVEVTFSNKKTIRFPYSTTKSMRDLFKDLSVVEKKSDTIVSVPTRRKESPVAVVEDEEEPQDPTLLKKKKIPVQTEFEELQSPDQYVKSGDILRCVKVLERAPGADVDIQLGAEYRVIMVKKSLVPSGNGMSTKIDYYEVIDDASKTPRRITAYPEEMNFLRKRTPAIAKITNMEIFGKCFQCDEKVALALDVKTKKYQGVCIDCGNTVVKNPPKPKKK